MMKERLNPLNDYLFLKIMGERGMKSSFVPSSMLF
jgi:hypothetical protein